MTEPRARAWLLYTESGIEREMALHDERFTIGRLPDRDLVLNVPYVSRQHAEIVREGEAFVLHDLGSKAGCFVNGSPVRQHTLVDGDFLQIGSVDCMPIQFKVQGDTTNLPLRSLLGQMQETGKHESGLGRLGWFLEAARRLNDLGPVHELAGALIESTLQLTRAERGYVFLRDGAGHLEFVAGRDMFGEVLASDATVSRSAIRRAVESRSEYIVTDTLSAEDGFEPSESVLTHSLRVVICIPLRDRSQNGSSEGGGLLGVLYLDSRQQRGKLTSVDSNLLNLIAAEAAALVHNAMLAEAEKTARQARAELQIAAQIQRGLMAVKLPQLEYATVNASSLPCKEIGGDFFDVVVTGGALNVVVADISGKGVSAALLGAMLQGLVHASLVAAESLEAIAMSANEFLCARDLGKYATLVLLRLQPDGAAEYINCGHVRPWRVSAAKLEALANANLPVGLIEAAEYTCEALQFEHGERLMIVTDGLTEAEDSEGQCYGDARLESILRRGVSLPEVLEDLRSFTCGRPLEDDCTVLEVRFRA